MKSYTNLEQSKRLAEILPLESADMWWAYYYDVISDTGEYDKEPMLHKPVCDPDKALPCWSLAALLGVIRETIGYTLYGVNNVYMFCNLGDKPWKLETEVYDNEIDVCCEMIIKLKGLNLL